MEKNMIKSFAIEFSAHFTIMTSKRFKKTNFHCSNPFLNIGHWMLQVLLSWQVQLVTKCWLENETVTELEKRKTRGIDNLKNILNG